MWGREMRAGLVFVVAALLVGGGFREWRRSHEERFQDLIAGLEARDARRVERESSQRRAMPGASSLGLLADSSHAASPRGSSLRATARGIPLGRVNPDRANAGELERLPGIGPALAARIVADRDSRGPFRAPEALLRVPGIGPRTLERIRAYLQFTAPAERESLSSF